MEVFHNPIPNSCDICHIFSQGDFAKVQSMDSETEICSRYEAELAGIARLDQAYFTNPRPTAADKASYVERQRRLEQLRTRFYLELSACRHPEAAKPPSFCVRVDDPVTGRPIVSAPQCSLSHDLNNYLNVIIVSSELLVESVPEDPVTIRRLKTILDTAKKMAARIRTSTCNLPTSQRFSKAANNF